MSRFLYSTVAFVIFVYTSFYVIGMGLGFVEQQSFIRSRTEYVTRVTEADPESLGVGGAAKSARLTQYEQDFKGVFPTLRITTELTEDRDGDGEVSYGDIVTVTFDAYGKGAFGFRKSQKLMTEQGVDSNLPRYKSVMPIMIHNR